MFVCAIIAAGGRGQRFGSQTPKQLMTIGGRTVLDRSVSLFLDHPAVREIVVALPADLAAEPPRYLLDTPKPVRIVAGGARRQDSVLNAFRAIDARADLVIVHDAARPFASAGLIDRTIAAAAEAGAALAALPARDTIKRARSATDPLVAETVPRDVIYLAQTPQAFRRAVLADALALGESAPEATDEAALAERAGHAVRLVPGEQHNIKITTPEDMPMVEAMLGSGPRTAVSPGRVGSGYDLHRLVQGRPLVIGGVTIPFDRGPLGHSDGDVACHSATDAILGAAALGDIGRHFPDTDPRWRGADSLLLLSRAVALVREHGFEVINLDVTVVLEAPKIKSHVQHMRERLAGAIGIPVDAVSVKGKTNEGVDAVGRGEAIAAHAVALLTRA